MSNTSNQHSGLRTLETKVVLLIFPIIFFSGYDLLKTIEKRTILLLYAFFVTIAGVAIVAIAMYRVNFLGQAGYTFADLAGIVKVHPGYFSLYVGFSTLILISYFQSFNTRQKAIIIFSVIFLTALNLMLVARMPLFAFMICILMYFILTKQYKLLMLFPMIVLTFLIFVGIQNEDWQERIFRPLKLIAHGDTTGMENFLFNRIQELDCSMEILNSEFVVLTGVGTGDDNDSLYKCYGDKKYDWVLSQRYNAHNQYIQSSLQNGVLGGLTFAFLIFSVFLFTKQAGNQLEFILFSLLFALFSLTESTLEVQKGVVFFSFFYTLFVSFAHQKPERCKNELDLA